MTDTQIVLIIAVLVAAFVIIDVATITRRAKREARARHARYTQQMAMYRTFGTWPR